MYVTALPRQRGIRPAVIKSENARWGKMVRDLNLKAE